MRYIDELLRLIRLGPQTISQLNNAKINMKSVAAGASGATFQFPCLTSDTIPIDMASCMCRSLDRVYASFVQTWLSLNPVIDISVDRTPADYLKRFHQNVKVESAIEDLSIEPEDLEGYMERAYRGEYKLYTSKDGSYGILFNVADRATREMMESHRELLSEHLSAFDLNPICEANDDVVGSLLRAAMTGDETKTNENNNDNVASSLLRAAMTGAETKANEKNIERRTTQFNNMKSPAMLDRDIKRVNDMIPFAIQVRLMAVNDAGQFVQYMDFVVGIKAILHPIKSDEIIVNIERILQNKSVFFKLLRWTTGEISLLKNIILDLDNIRFDAMHSSDGRSPWFPRLKQLKAKKIGVHSLTVPHGVIPNSSLIISAYEANWLNNRGINIRDPKIASKVIDGLFLMTFVILDDSTGTVDILYNDSTAFQTYALESLEREVSLNSNKLGKEIGRMISR